LAEKLGSLAAPDVLDKFLRKAKPAELYKLLTSITTYHRVQGSSEIVEAAKKVVEWAHARGLNVEFDVVRGCVCLDREWFFWEPMGWELKNAELEVRESNGWRCVVSTDDHPLVAVVHSPAGVVEGRAGFGNSDIVVRIDELGYWEAVEENVAAIVASHWGPGIRYFAVFPPCNAKQPRVPALSIPNSVLGKIVGRQVRVSVDAEYAEHVMPLVRIRIGEIGGPQIVVVAHICHPTPGAHDNASGVVAALGVAKLLTAYEQLLVEKGVGVTVMLVPEHTGTAYTLSKSIVDPKTIIAGLSLDMVGANLGKTGGSLLLLSSLYSLPSPLDPLLYTTLWNSFSQRGHGTTSYPTEPLYIQPYDAGSDHDILVSYGIPASMINEWPDKYYHTSLDEPSNIDMHRLAKIVASVATSIVLLVDRLSQVGELLNTWKNYIVYSNHLHSIALPHDNLETLSKLLDRGVNATLYRIEEIFGKTVQHVPWEANVEIRRRGTISKRWLKLQADSEYQELLRLENEEESMYLKLAPLVLQATRSIEAAKLELVARTGKRVDEELLDKVLSLVSRRS